MTKKKSKFVHEVDKRGTKYIRGEGRLAIFRDWLSVDDDGIVTEDCFDYACKAIAQVLFEMKFRVTDLTEKMITIDGDSIIFMQNLSAIGKVMTKHDAKTEAIAIISQYMDAAVKAGYFNDVSPDVIQKSLEAQNEVQETR